MRKKNKVILFIFSFVLLLANPHCAKENIAGLSLISHSAIVLKEALSNLGVEPKLRDKAFQELNAQASQHNGFNSLYEIEAAALNAGLKTRAIKTTNIATLRSFLAKGQIIANITDNHNFCLIREIGEDSVLMYLPGLNAPEFAMSYQEFLASWNNVALFISKQAIYLGQSEVGVTAVSDKQAQDIVGIRPCSNPGPGRPVTGEGGINGPARRAEEIDKPKDSITEEPVVIHNGNLFLDVDDIVIPTKGLPLALTRHYNS